MSLQDTPRANRLHIGLFGRRNAGKSSLLNALTKQGASLVSEVAGTTTDPVYKAMELPGVGAVVFIDTAGFDDTGALGEARVAKTRQAAEKTDLALLLFPAEEMAAGGLPGHMVSFGWVSDDLFVIKSGQIFKCFANHLKNLTTCIIIKTAAV